MLDLALEIELALSVYRDAKKNDGAPRLTITEQKDRLSRLRKAMREVVGTLREPWLKDRLVSARKRHGDGGLVRMKDIISFDSDMKAVERIADDLHCYTRDVEAELVRLLAEQQHEQRGEYRANNTLIEQALRIWTGCLEQPSTRNGQLVFSEAFKCLYDQLRNRAGCPEICESERKRLLRNYKELESRRQFAPRL
jgi:hypothetical protein